MSGRALLHFPILAKAGASSQPTNPSQAATATQINHPFYGGSVAANPSIGKKQPGGTGVGVWGAGFGYHLLHLETLS